MVIGFVIETYTLVDDLLSDIIGNIYLSDYLSDNDVEFWDSNPLASFVHNVLDVLYPLQKLRVIDDVEAIPKQHRATVERLNELRNALAHSFFPEQRRSYRRSGVVQYKGEDIFTVKGLMLFDDDRDELLSYLWQRAHNEPL